MSDDTVLHLATAEGLATGALKIADFLTSASHVLSVIALTRWARVVVMRPHQTGTRTPARMRAQTQTALLIKAEG